MLYNGWDHFLLRFVVSSSIVLELDGILVDLQAAPLGSETLF